MITRRQTLKGGLALGAVASGAFRGAAVAENFGPSPLTLWYTQPAEQWTEALPIGNGRLGAMIFGGVARERLQLNEDTLYAGGPYDPSNPEALEALPRVRALIAAGNYVDAQNLAQERMMARPIRMPSYQTVGDLILNFGPSAYSQNYRRDLDLDRACASVKLLVVASLSRANRLPRRSIRSSSRTSRQIVRARSLSVRISRLRCPRRLRSTTATWC